MYRAAPFVLDCCDLMQSPSETRVPGSEDFDNFFDHHIAGGGSTVRLVHVFLMWVLQPGDFSMTSIAIWHHISIAQLAPSRTKMAWPDAHHA